MVSHLKRMGQRFNLYKRGPACQELGQVPVAVPGVAGGMGGAISQRRATARALQRALHEVEGHLHDVET